jgi:hypothetical protein
MACQPRTRGDVASGFSRKSKWLTPTAAVIRYVLENPLRARLAASVSEYPFIGSSEYPVVPYFFGSGIFVLAVAGTWPRL